LWPAGDEVGVGFQEGDRVVTGTLEQFDLLTDVGQL
jgi:hypothetical protein